MVSGFFCFFVFSFKIRVFMSYAMLKIDIHLSVLTLYIIETQISFKSLLPFLFFFFFLGVVMCNAI